MEPFFPFVLLGLAIGLLIWGVNNLSVEGRYTKLFTTSAIAVGAGLLGWFFTTYGRVGPQNVMIPGLLLLVGLLVWGLINPAVGRATRQDLCRDRDGPRNGVPGLGNQRGNEW
jgi:hypothetical protein